MHLFNLLASTFKAYLLRQRYQQICPQTTLELGFRGLQVPHMKVLLLLSALLLLGAALSQVN